MSATTMLSTDILAGPVLIIRPGLQGQIIERGSHDYNVAVRLDETADTAVPVAQCSLTITTAGAVVELLDVAHATWEDAEWQ